MKKLLMTNVLTMIGLCAMAQSIDFNMTNRSMEEVNEPNYISWPVNTVQSESKTLDNGVTLTLTACDGANVLRAQWNKNTVTLGKNGATGLRLLGDGVQAFVLDDDNNTPNITEGSTAIMLTIEGLEAGQHSLLAYHNYKDGNTTLPDIQVEVNGQVLASGVKYSCNVQKPSETGSSFVEFTAVEGQPVVIKYSTTPVSGKTYGSTCMTLNGLEFDVNPYSAMDPTPDNYDFHADGKNEIGAKSVTLRWTPANVAVSHRLVFGTDSTEVANATAYQYTGKNAQYEATGLSPLQKYWWRVDEVDEKGNVYKGKTWCFQPRRLAFPGAEGYGRFAIGGRGGIVYHVTSLDDDATNPQPGTFRYGISNIHGPRTIVFDVAGTIHLKARLTCSDKYVTIAGQTAPGRGIMFRGAPFGMQSDGITRFIRARRGHISSEDSDDKGLDGLGMAGNDHSIMDHCSISWTIDEAFSSRNAKHITLQNTLISEALNIAGHPNYSEGSGHGYAATIGGGEYGAVGSSFHHNLLAHNEGRNWSISGGLDGKGYYDGHHDIFNNVVYNWGGRACDGGTHELNFVNNYYKKGPATSQNYILRHQFEGTGQGTQRAYVSGNIREETSGRLTQDKEGTTYRYDLSNDQVLDWEPWSKEPFFPSYATIETAEAAFKNVLCNVGCNQPELDNHDTRIIQETLLGTTSTVGSKGKRKGIIDHEDDSEGFAGLNIIEAQREADWDTDQDGIPNWYEKVTGTDINIPNNNECHDNYNYYTDLEQYLNWIAEPNFILNGAEEKAIDLKPYFAGYKNFEVVDDSVRPTNGFVWNFEGTTLKVQDLFGRDTSRRQFILVTVKDPNTDITLTRQFNFATIDGNLSGIVEVKDNEHSKSSPIYNIAGQRISQSQKGINIQNGKKFIKK